jgi:hypothetical protein
LTLGIGYQVKRVGEDSSVPGWAPGIVTAAMAMNGWPVVKWPNVMREEMGVDPATLEIVEVAHYFPVGVRAVPIDPHWIPALESAIEEVFAIDIAAGADAAINGTAVVATLRGLLAAIRGDAEVIA